MSIKKILITGGAGMIGSSLTKALIHRNYDVTIIDNFWRGKIEYLNSNGKLILPTSKIIKGDLTNLEFCKQEIKNL